MNRIESIGNSLMPVGLRLLKDMTKTDLIVLMRKDIKFKVKRIR